MLCLQPVIRGSTPAQSCLVCVTCGVELYLLCWADEEALLKSVGLVRGEFLGAVIPLKQALNLQYKHPLYINSLPQSSLKCSPVRLQESCSRHLFTVLLIITVHQAAKACYLLECSLSSFPLFLKSYSCIIDGHGHFPQGIIPVKLNITVQIFGAAWITDLTPWLIWAFIICHSLWSYKYRYCIYALQFIGKEYIVTDNQQ